MYDAAENDDFDREEIPTYEEVAKLYPRPGLYRPVVLIGPPGVGRNELKRRLMATDAEKYKTPVPCKFNDVQLRRAAARAKIRFTSIGLERRIILARENN